MYVWFEWSKKRVLYFVFSNTLEIFLKKPQKKDESTDVCLFPRYLPRSQPRVNIVLYVWLYVFLFILYLVNEE